MIALLARIAARLRRFRTETAGTMTVEFALVASTMLWAYAGSFVYFDAFRISNVNQKAAYTIADLISRQTRELDPAYLNGMNKLFDYLNARQMDSHIRVSSIGWDQQNNRFKINWSYATKSFPAQTTTTINLEAYRLPNLALGDTEILVETWTAYTPPFGSAVPAQTLYQFIVARPRLAPQVVFNAS